MVQFVTEGKKVVETLTKRKATNGEIIKLSKSAKRVASGILDKAQRRQYINMQLDATRSQKLNSQRRNKEKVDATSGD